MSDELEKRLDTGMYGTPRVNPDEQRKYLGTFRERCYLSMTVAEMKKKDNQETLQSVLPNYQGALIFILKRQNHLPKKIPSKKKNHSGNDSSAKQTNGSITSDP